MARIQGGVFFPDPASAYLDGAGIRGEPPLKLAY